MQTTAELGCEPGYKRLGPKTLLHTIWQSRNVFAYFWVSSYEALVVVRFFHGFATAIYGPVAMAVVVSEAGNRRAELLSWFSSITIIGNLVGAPLGGLLLTLMSGEACQ